MWEPRCWLLLLMCSGAKAYPSFARRVPNGERVPCPDNGHFAQGCSPGDVSKGESPSMCFGLGHQTCKGATLPLNPFGQDLKAAGFIWTKALCEKDSDGDGQSNGEELGDPCCLWAEGDTPSSYTACFTPSHPGLESHKQLPGYTRPSCVDTELNSLNVAPAVKGPTTRKYLDSEEQRSQTFFIKNYTIPAIRTTYVDFGFNFVDDTQDIFYIVGGDMLVDQPKFLHHYVMYGCSEPISEEDGVVLMSVFFSCRGRLTLLGFWAPGVTLFDVPTHVGIPIGRGAGVRSILLNVHYTNPSFVKGQVTNDGFRVKYTPQARSHDMHPMFNLFIFQDATLTVPPHKKRFFVTRTCTVCKVPKDVTIAYTYYHAHLLGTEMYQEVSRDGISSDFGSQPRWHYDDQALHKMFTSGLTLKPGDRFQSTCVFDSTGQNKSTKFGLETVDEMCIAGVWYIKPVAEAAHFNCEAGSVWTGDLSPEEDVLGIEFKHPGPAGSKPMKCHGDTGNACDETQWPDKKYGSVCADCKVLVNHFGTDYKTCNGYCERRGLQCVGAWDDDSDSCKPKFNMTCNQTLSSSDAICECSPEVTNPTAMSSPTPITPTGPPVRAQTQPRCPVKTDSSPTPSGPELQASQAHWCRISFASSFLVPLVHVTVW